MRLSYFDRFFF